ncbi:MAG: HD domain-containing protein [Verrucomicrobiota bacterium]
MSWRDHIVAYIHEQAQPPDKFSHQARLYHLTRKIGEGLTYDDDIVFAAAWMHDLGVFIGHRPEDPVELAHWDCVAYAMHMTPEILAKLGFPHAKIAAVVEAIRTHQPQAEPKTQEGLILRDADILEQLGAVNIMRMFAKVGRDTRYQTFSDALAVLQKCLNTLPPQLRLENARTLAQPRIRILMDFLQAARQEADGQPL